jgi:hypothetical protein
MLTLVHGEYLVHGKVECIGIVALEMIQNHGW